jgi:hypothetical protein
MNEMIGAAAKKHTEVTVLDWNGLARVHPDWMQPDGIHLTPAGAQGMATMINDSLFDLGLATRAGTVARQLSIAAGTLPRARVGRPYSARLQARGGTAPYRWTRVSGAMAPGLRLTPSGLVEGTAKRVGRYRIVFRVVDRAGTARTRAFVLGVER